MIWSGTYWTAHFASGFEIASANILDVAKTTPSVTDARGKVVKILNKGIFKIKNVNIFVVGLEIC